MQRPLKLHISGHLVSPQSMPLNNSEHSQVPVSTSHLPLFDLELQSALHVFVLQAAPLNFCPWKLGFTSTRLHTQVALMHTPLPLQLSGQYFSEQSRPRNPASHLHLPSSMQRPWKPHSFSQAVMPQFAPVQPSSHWQLPLTQFPCPLQSSGQLFSAQSSPVHIWPSNAAADFLTGLHLHLPEWISQSPCSTYRMLHSCPL